MKSLHFCVCDGHCKKMCKKWLVFDAIHPCIWKALLRVASVCRKSSARARGRLKLPSAPSPLSPEVEAAARSAAGTQQLVRRCPPPESWQSNNTWLESLFQHCGQLLTSCRVRARNRAAVRASCENGDGDDGSFKRPQARALFLHTEVTCERTFRCKTVWHRERVFFYTFRF